MRLPMSLPTWPRTSRPTLPRTSRPMSPDAHRGRLSAARTASISSRTRPTAEGATQHVCPGRCVCRAPALRAAVRTSPTARAPACRWIPIPRIAGPVETHARCPTLPRRAPREAARLRPAVPGSPTATRRHPTGARSRPLRTPATAEPAGSCATCPTRALRALRDSAPSPRATPGISTATPSPRTAVRSMPRPILFTAGPVPPLASQAKCAAAGCARQAAPAA